MAEATPIEFKELLSRGVRSFGVPVGKVILYLENGAIATAELPGISVSLKEFRRIESEANARADALNAKIAARSGKKRKRTKKEKPVRPEMQVYFIRAGEFVKIGVAYDPKHRAKSIQTGSANPVEIIHTIDGGRRVESELHKRFAANRVRKNGEWFQWCDEIAEFIAANRSAGDR